MNDILGAPLYIFGLFVVVPFLLFSDWGFLRMKKNTTTTLPKEVSDMLDIVNKRMK